VSKTDQHAELKERLKNVPLQPGVYLYKDREERVIYVGKAKSLRQRMRSYFQSPDRLHPKVRAMMNRVADFDFIVTNTEVEALILESNLIKAYQPRYNIDLRDDKSYPYLKITIAEEYPRVCLVREEKDGVSRYFGPYTDVTALRETLRLLNTLFPLRTCKTLRQLPRPCLNSDMERCLAPCTGQVGPEEYRQVVEEMVAFLEGRDIGILEQKEREMQEAAAQLEFEKAARLRDQVQAIKKVYATQKINFSAPYNLDLVGMVGGDDQNLTLVFKVRAGKIIAKDTFWLNRAMAESDAEIMEYFLKHYYQRQTDIPGEILVSHAPLEGTVLSEWLRTLTGHRVEVRIPQRGDKKQLLDMVLENALLLWEERKREDLRLQESLHSLARTLDLEVVPQRIEAYDISHLGGEETVASMVVFTGGEADRGAYRRFKIHNDQNNDFASLAEALQRRFRNAREGNPSFLPEPDLILIDGGLGQVNAVRTSLEKAGVEVPVCGLAKKNEEVYLPFRLHPLRLSRRDPGLMLLQRLRDEAHRFAVEYNRQRRGKKVRASELDRIEGIGPQRKQALLSSFGSVKRIRQASLEEILAVPGMNIKVARKVYEYFHPRGGESL
jgi:excinuclease ABC subunit C